MRKIKTAPAYGERFFIWNNPIIFFILRIINLNAINKNIHCVNNDIIYSLLIKM